MPTLSRSIRTGLAVTAVLTLSLPADASTSRVSFKRGTSSATLSGRFRTVDDMNTYLLKVKDGQTIKITASAKVSVFVVDPNGDDATDADLSCNSKKIIDETFAGDYEVQVSPCLKYDNPLGSYKVTLAVV